MNTAKKLIKTGLQWIAPSLGPHRFTLRRHNLLILTYHRVLPPEDNRIQLEQPGMYVTPATFSMQLKFLRKYFTFVKLDEWLQQSKHPGNLPRRSCAITFDDGWRDNYDHAYPILQQQQIPATLFLVSSLIGTHYDFWPGKLAKLLHHTAEHHSTEWQHPLFNWLKQPGIHYRFNNQAPTSEELDQIIRACKRYSDTENNQYLATALQHTGYPAAPNERSLLNASEIREMLNSGLINIGSHTANHIRMSDALNTAELHTELVESRQHLATRFNTRIQLFCYPNGDTSKTAIATVRQHYLGACTTQRGWNTPHSDPYLLRRINLHEDMSNTPEKLLTKISGWL